MSNHKNKITEAVYINPEIEEYLGNPFICALPPIQDTNSVIRGLRALPAIHPHEINMPAHLRVHAMQRLLTQFFQPTIQHLTLETRLSILIRQGYIGRNPASPDFIKHLNNGYDRIVKQDMNLTVRTDVNITSNSFGIVGTSGCGKSLALRRILDGYPQAIYHPKLHLIQVPWLKLECPGNGSLKQLCNNFFVALDRCLGTQYFKNFGGRTRVGPDELVAHMAHLAQVHGIGVLVIDEIQNLSVQRSGGEQIMLNFFVTLVNDVGIPVVLVGTPKARRLFAKDFSQARRSAGLGSVSWEQMQNDNNWEKLTTLLWDYQWIHHKAPITASIRQTLYDCSQGIIDILVKLFVLSQWRAMLTKVEELSEPLILQVYKDEFRAVHPMIAALKSGDPRRIEMYGDLKMSDIENKMIQAFDSEMPIVQAVHEPQSYSEEPEKVKKLLEVALSLGLERDIALPLIEAEVSKNPSMSVIHVMHRITTQLTDINVAVKKQKLSKKPKTGDWHQCQEDDMRNLFFHKGDVAMHQMLKDSGIVVSVDDYLRYG